MAKSFLTDEEVEQEIDRLSGSEEVRLAKLEQRIKYRRRQRLYNLRVLEERGRKLMEAGITADVLRQMDAEAE